MVRSLISFLLVASFASAAWSQDGDPETGERVFRQCATCHSFDPTDRRPGPHLSGIYGNSAGSVDGFRYSPAMQDSDIVWTTETLSEYIADPRGYLPGTSMMVGVRRPSDVADVVAYLKSKSSE